MVPELWQHIGSITAAFVAAAAMARVLGCLGIAQGWAIVFFGSLIVGPLSLRSVLYLYFLTFPENGALTFEIGAVLQFLQWVPALFFLWWLALRPKPETAT
jgi:hypothetical protein